MPVDTQIDPYYSTFEHELETVLAIGLKPWINVPKGEEYFIGEVKPSLLPRTGGDPRVVIRCYVTHYPARFFRFAIVRPNEDDPDRLEEVEVKAASGSFAKYWPFALAVALDEVGITKIESK